MRRTQKCTSQIICGQSGLEQRNESALLQNCTLFKTIKLSAFPLCHKRWRNVNNDYIGYNITISSNLYRTSVDVGFSSIVPPKKYTTFWLRNGVLFIKKTGTLRLEGENARFSLYFWPFYPYKQRNPHFYLVDKSGDCRGGELGI